MVLQTRIFFLVRKKVVDQGKKSEFAEPLFYTFLEKWLQIKWSSVYLTVSFAVANFGLKLSAAAAEKNWQIDVSISC